MEIVEEPIVQVDVGRVDIAVPPEIPVAEIPVVQEEPAVKPSERESIPTTKAKRAPLRKKSSSTSAPETVPITRVNSKDWTELKRTYKTSNSAKICSGPFFVSASVYYVKSFFVSGSSSKG